MQVRLCVFCSRRSARPPACPCPHLQLRLGFHQLPLRHQHLHQTHGRRHAQGVQVQRRLKVEGRGGQLLEEQLLVAHLGHLRR